QLAGAQATTLAEIVAADPRLSIEANAKARKRVLARAEDVAQLAYARTDIAYEVIARLTAADAALRLRCGVAACPNPGQLVEKLVEVLERWNRDRTQDARQLLDGDRSVRYSQHWTSRGPTADRFVERRYSKTGAEPQGPAGLVRLRA